MGAGYDGPMATFADLLGLLPEVSGLSSSRLEAFKRLNPKPNANSPREGKLAPT